MKSLVMKFGGTSVSSNEARLRACLRVISAKEKGYCPVVVVSAIGRKGQPYATDTLIGMMREIDPAVAPDPRELDLMLACGEILSAVIFAHTLKTLGHAAMAFRGGQAGIRTDGVYGNARIVSIQPTSILRAINDGSIPVICGFQGVYVGTDRAPGAELTTLGRGGSDTTAAAIGAAIDAESVEIYTDVDGVKTADPDYVNNAPTLRVVSYDEVAEIAHLGAKVLHPRAAEIAMKFDIPLWVKNTFSDDPGTKVVKSDEFPGRRMTGVTHSGKLIYLQFDLSGIEASLRSELRGYIYEILYTNGLNLFMTNLSPQGIGFAIPRSQLTRFQELFDGLVAFLDDHIALFSIGAVPSAGVVAQQKLLARSKPCANVQIDMTENCSMVSIIGHEMMQEAGLFVRVLRMLDEAQIPVLQTSDSELSLSCLVPESETERAVHLLHSAFAPQAVE